MEDLPLPIRKFLQSPERDAVSLRLTQKYGLHADDAGTFERAYIYMLLGVFTPDEFVQELRENGLNENTIRGLATDVNEQVFKKLRQEERKEGPMPGAYHSTASVPQVPPMQIGERPAVPENLPGQDELPQWAAPAPKPEAIQYSAPPQPPAPPVVFHTPPQPIPPPPAQQPAPQTPVQSTPIYSNAPQLASAPTAGLPYARTMAGDMERAIRGEKSPVAPVSPPRMAGPVMQRTPMPVPESPANPPLAASMPHAPSPQPPHQAEQHPPAPPIPASWQRPSTAPVRRMPINRLAASDTPITKEYGNDPYREPVE